MTTSAPKVKSIMTADPTTIDRSRPLSEVYQLLRDAPFHHVIVTEDDAPIGMIATSDILRLVYDIDGKDDRSLRTYIDYQFSIEDAMTLGLKSLGPEATIREAAALLSDGSFHSVVILDHSNSLAGIVTTTDLARYLAQKPT